MKFLLYMISLAGLLLTILPPFLLFRNAITHQEQNTIMTIGFVLWFMSAWFWLGRREKSAETHGGASGQQQ
jgi:hypothetical protein